MIDRLRAWLDVAFLRAFGLPEGPLYLNPREARCYRCEGPLEVGVCALRCAGSEPVSTVRAVPPERRVTSEELLGKLSEATRGPVCCVCRKSVRLDLLWRAAQARDRFAAEAGGGYVCSDACARRLLQAG